MTIVEVVSVSGAIAYLPLDYLRSNTDSIWVRTKDGSIEPAWKTIELYLPNKDIPVEVKESWGDENESPYESLKQ